MVLIQSKTVDILHVLPRLEGYDQVQPFFRSHTLGAEHGCDVDDADAAHLHVVSGQLRTGANDLAAIE